MAEIKVILTIEDIKQETKKKLFKDICTIYICYQCAEESTVAEGYNTNILAVCTDEESAQKICCHNGDSYTPIELNKDYGRIPEDTSDIAIYNVNGHFIKGDSVGREVSQNNNTIILQH